jgi:hypothetical protein
MVVGAIVLAPVAFPVSSIERFAAYQEALGPVPRAPTENWPIGTLPQPYAAVFGWRDLAAQVG